MFAGVWVGGEVQRPQLSRNGHLYFQLVEKGAGDQLRASLGAVLFRRDRLRVTRHLREAGLELEEGQSLRCFGRLDFYAVSYYGYTITLEYIDDLYGSLLILLTYPDGYERHWYCTLWCPSQAVDQTFQRHLLPMIEYQQAMKKAEALVLAS